MAKYHVNPETGRAGQCSATFKCPFGDLETDHYVTAAEARKSFERKMAAEEEAAETKRKEKAAKRLGDPIIYPTVKRWTPNRDIRYALDYHYERSYNHPPNEDICRCGTIDQVEIIGWRDNGEGLAEYAKFHLGIKETNELPEALKKDLIPFVNNFNSSDFEPEVAGGYYGEELHGIDAPEELMKVLDDHYYAQEDAAGPDNILTYLRGKGYATAGERPLEAIKGSLQAENNGRLAAKVAKAKKWRTGTIAINNIVLPSESQKKAGENDPRPLDSPYGRKPPTGSIAGVVLQNKDGSYELIDGYHRLGWLNANGKKRKQYIILSHEDYREPSRYAWLRDNEPSWYKE